MAFSGVIVDQFQVERLGWTLLHFIWQATVLAILFAGAQQLLLKEASATHRYLTGCVLLLLIGTAPVLTFWYLTTCLNEPEPLILPFEVAGNNPSWVGLGNMLRHLLPYLVMLWFAAAAIVVLLKLGGAMVLQRLIAQKSRVIDRSDFQDLRACCGIRRRVTFRETALVDSPATLGWLRPVILLPPSSSTLLNGLRKKWRDQYSSGRWLRPCEYLRLDSQKT